MKPIEEHFDDIVKNKESWKYYYMSNTYNSYKEIENEASEFIQDYLERGKKIEFYDKDVLNSILLNNEKCKHTVSIFFLGICMYQNCTLIKQGINKFLQETENKYRDFIYYWFLTCLFHDFGYAYEKELSETICNCKLELFNSQTIDYPNFIENVIPKTIVENWLKYHNYRNQRDHGIAGGIEYYYNRYKTFYHAKRDSKSNSNIFIWKNLNWNKNRLFKEHLLIAWTIISHNIWFADEFSGEFDQIKMIEKYKEFELDGLIIDKPQIYIGRHPFLFLLSFVDTIDPSKDKNVDLSIGLLFENDTIKIKTSNYDYKEKLSNQDYWLGIQTEVNDETLTIKIS